MSSILPSIRRHVIAGTALTCFLVFGFGGWAATAKLAGAVIAPGTIVVETHSKKVQHPTGGVVGEVLVKDGDVVEAGDVLIRLDETVTRANLVAATKTLDELNARRARLEAERDGSTAIDFPKDLLDRAARESDIAKLISGERKLIDARRTADDGQKAQLGERVTQLNQQIEGLEKQIAAKNEQITLITGELQSVRDLYSKKLVSLERMNLLERDAAQLKGDHGQLTSAIAEAKGKIAETKLQIIQVDQDSRKEVLHELSEIQGKIAELARLKVAAEDQLNRIAIRSPCHGIVDQLSVYASGAVIHPEDILMLIVPNTDALTIEARVMPKDIDQVGVGQESTVRLSAFNRHTTPELFGKVVRVAADATIDEKTGASWYVTRVELPDSELRRVSSIKLVPGMPADVHIEIGERTPLSYLLKPLTDGAKVHAER